VGLLDPQAYDPSTRGTTSLPTRARTPQVWPVMDESPGASDMECDKTHVFAAPTRSAARSASLRTVRPASQMRPFNRCHRDGFQRRNSGAELFERFAPNPMAPAFFASPCRSRRVRSIPQRPPMTHHVFPRCWRPPLPMGSPVQSRVQHTSVGAGKVDSMQARISAAVAGSEVIKE